MYSEAEIMLENEPVKRPLLVRSLIQISHTALGDKAREESRPLEREGVAVGHMMKTGGN